MLESELEEEKEEKETKWYNIFKRKKQLHIKKYEFVTIRIE